eukprot:559502-Lingulodinium_polyedra.AAC.1
MQRRRNRRRTHFALANQPGNGRNSGSHCCNNTAMMSLWLGSEPTPGPDGASEGKLQPAAWEA